MVSHKPSDYNCPFCQVVKGIESDKLETRQDDIVHRNDYVTAFIASSWWPNNKGHVLIVPNEHFENIYELPDEYIYQIHRLEKEIAIALKKVYQCDGVSSRQHNEPAGDQDVWHYHLHVFPRYDNDNLYACTRMDSSADQRKKYSKRLRDYFNTERLAKYHSSPLAILHIEI